MKSFFALVLIINIGFWFWSMSPYAESQRDPGRLELEVNPQTIAVRPLQSTTPTDEATSEVQPNICLESGPYLSSEIELIGVAVSSIAPPSSWTKVPVVDKNVWAIYLGPFSKETLARKTKELERDNIYHEPSTPSDQVEPGLILGRFAERTTAQAKLADASQKQSLKQARLISLSLPPEGFFLRIETINENLAQRLRSMRSNLIKPFNACLR